MDRLEINGTNQSPSIILDAKNGVFELRGHSFLDNAYDFYKPVLDWLKAYHSNSGDNIHFVFDIIYINTSSQRMVFDLLKRLNLMHKDGKSVMVEWLYDENDDDLKDVGNDLLSFMEFPYKVIEKVS
ncbi:MAG: DUF1987 domain-containing protein [Bacteroidia bacterium]